MAQCCIVLASQLGDGYEVEVKATCLGVVATNLFKAVVSTAVGKSRLQVFCVKACN